MACGILRKYSVHGMPRALEQHPAGASSRVVGLLSLDGGLSQPNQPPPQPLRNPSRESPAHLDACLLGNRKVTFENSMESPHEISPALMNPLEERIGYKFRNSLLL